ncbi:S8 family serine peptidase [Portibacter lacus]|uniref:T9SS C-terminal target domain-containing protein n=1 Tax=Portibacter lacus TaxID=1099794 RepID=A0AA37SMD2_9BACT|nr:S8 family serine peptidase [Portibacter lacus]GLR17378.1 hypothetical protein GCM10007940_19930 [Portibacter lacus]
MHKFLLIFSFIFWANFTFAQESEVIKGQCIVQLQENMDIAQVFNSRSFINIKDIEKISDPFNIYLIHFNEEISAYEDLASTLKANDAVLHIMPNMTVVPRRAPNDKHFSKQLTFERIQAEKAWDITTGGTTALGERIVVAILDSGFDDYLLDIEENLYINEIEQPGDANQDGCPGVCGVDDDNDGKIDEDLFGRIPSHPLYNPNAAGDDDENGYIDDRRGVNFENKTDVHPKQEHGTAVAGIIGAKGHNGIGVSGINWDVDMMLLSNTQSVGQIVEAYTYVYNQRRLYNETNGALGANVMVTNISSGIDNRFGSEFPMWCNLYDKLGSVGILSVGSTSNSETNVDEEGDLPTTCSSPYLISVTNTTLDDELYRGGFGPINIDLGAPGQGTLSTSITGTDNVDGFSGTSASAPHVAGALALFHSIPCEAFAQRYKDNPSLVLEIKDFLLKSTDPLPDLVGKTLSEGRLNIYETMIAFKDICPGNEGGDLAIKKVFPNPSFSYNEEINIEYISQDGETDYDFLIFDITGKLIYSKNFDPPVYGERVLNITPPTLASGVYYFVIRSEKEVASHKQVILPY